MGFFLYYIVLVAAWLGAIGYLHKGINGLNNEGIPRPTTIRTITMGLFGTFFWLMIIVISAYNQFTATTTH